jgi:hypothetical protein
MRRYGVTCGCTVVFILALVAVVFAVELTAETVTKEGNKSRAGKIYVKDTKVRLERANSPIYSIVRGDKGVVWQINGAENTYAEGKLTPAAKPRIEEKIAGEVSRKQVGQETIDGHPVKKYEVVVKDGGKSITYLQWFATDLTFPVKLATTDGSWGVEYKNIRKGAVDTLFELPKGVEIDRTTVPDVLSGGGH